MAINLSSKEQAIARILEIIHARVRFNQELRSYLGDASFADAKKYLLRVCPEFRYNYDSATDKAAAIETLRKTYIYLISKDLERLAEQKENIEAILKNDTPINVLTAVITLFYEIEQEKHNIIIRNNAAAERKRSLARQARNEVKQQLSSTSSSKASIKSAATTAARLAVTQEYDYLDAAEKSELALYEEILALLFTSNIAGQIEKDCIERNLILKFVPDGTYSLGLQNRFTRNLKPMANRILEMAKQFIGLQNLTPEIRNELGNEINRLYSSLMSIVGNGENRAIDFKSSAAQYNFILNLPTIVDELERRIKEEIAAEQAWKDEQDRISQEEQKRVQELAAVEAAREHQRILDLHLAEIEQEQLLAAQKEKQKEQEVLAKKEQEEKLAAAAELRKTQLTQRKAEVEANRIKNEVARRKARLASIKDSQKITTNQDGSIQSSFKLPDEIIQENSTALLELFDHAITTIPYRQAVKLISDLGGEIDTSSGSSHQRIIFNGCIYSDIEAVETESTQETETSSATAHVKKGFARKSEICGFNLKLLRNAIACVLPEDWKSKLKANTQCFSLGPH